MLPAQSLNCSAWQPAHDCGSSSCGRVSVPAWCAAVTWRFQVSAPRAGGAGADWLSGSFIVFACDWMVTGGEYVSTRGPLWQLTTAPLSALPPFEPPHAQKQMAMAASAMEP